MGVDPARYLRARSFAFVSINFNIRRASSDKNFDIKFPLVRGKNTTTTTTTVATINDKNGRVLIKKIKK